MRVCSVMPSRLADLTARNARRVPRAITAPLATCRKSPRTSRTSPSRTIGSGFIPKRPRKKTTANWRTWFRWKTHRTCRNWIATAALVWPISSSPRRNGTTRLSNTTCGGPQSCWSRVRHRGLQDAFVDAGLASLLVRRSGCAWRWRRRALSHEDAPPSERVNALFVIADTAFKCQQWALAREALQQLILLRRHSVDWTLLGLCESAWETTQKPSRRCVGPPKSIPIEPTSTSSLRGSTRRRAMREQAGRHRQWAEALAAADRRRAGPRQ